MFVIIDDNKIIIWKKLKRKQTSTNIAMRILLISKQTYCSFCFVCFFLQMLSAANITAMQLQDYHSANRLE